MLSADPIVFRIFAWTNFLPFHHGREVYCSVRHFTMLGIAGILTADRETSIQVSSLKSWLYQYYLSALNLSYGIDDLRTVVIKLYVSNV